MDMMPITNVFNEWYAANTSRKVRAIFTANARRGKSNMSYSPYGYVFSDDGKRTFVINDEVSANVQRIFEMRAKGIPPRQIGATFNREGIQTPQDYKVEKLGKYASLKSYHLWTDATVRKILANPAYIGSLALQRRTTVSYKNHKAILRPEEEWIVTENAHPAIFSKELWNRVREVEKSVSQGKQTRKGLTHPFSGFLFCADCGAKMKLEYYPLRSNGQVRDYVYTFNCGCHKRLGKTYCFSHYIKASDIESILLEDIKSKSKFIVANEVEVRETYLRKQTQSAEKTEVENRYELERKKKRFEKLDLLIEGAFEEKLEGKIPEEVCIKLIEKYSAERQELSAAIGNLEANGEAFQQAKIDIEEFIGRVKKHLNEVSVTRELCLELIDKIVVGGNPSVTGKPQEIEIYYKINLNSVI